MAKTIEASVPQDPSFSIPEIQSRAHHRGGVEVIEGANDVLRGMHEAELAAFMEEPVKVMMNPPASDSEMVGTSLTVCPDTQWVIFGREQTIKRKYVEVLVNARTQNFRQVNNPQNPAESRPQGSTVLSYPFSVTGDSAKGFAWLKALMASRG